MTKNFKGELSITLDLFAIFDATVISDATLNFLVKLIFVITFDSAKSALSGIKLQILLIFCEIVI